MKLHARRKTSVTILVVALVLACGLSKQPARGAEGTRGLHLPRDKPVSFNYVRTDGGGFRWDFQYYGTVTQGTNHAYGGGLYCQVSGSNVQAPDRQGYANQNGDEIEIGPFSTSGLNVSRRIKVYEDRPLARWLDIFENPTGQPITVPVQIYTHINYGIGRTKTSSGGESFGEKDWAFITETRGGNNIPSLLHVVCGDRSKFRPQVQMSSNSEIYVRWQLTVPAGGTVILCYFESQSQSVEAHEKLMSKFRIFDLVKDLPPGVRKMIVNFPVGSGFGDIDIDRSETSDTIILTNRDPMYGKIVNKAFVLKTFYGDVTLPAEKVIGMVPIAEDAGAARVLMVDGQMISGRVSEPTISMEMPSGGGTLNVPLQRIKQWSYQISKDRPAEVAFSGPVAILRTGDRLVFDTAAVKFTFLTQHGSVPVAGKDLLEVALDNAPNAVHRAVFLNGSRLGGFLEPEKLDLTLKIGPKMTVRRDLISKIIFSEDDKPAKNLTQIVLSNDDELFGELTDKTLVVATEFGSRKVEPRNIRAMTFSPAQIGAACMQLWDGSVHRGILQQEQLSFTIQPGPELKLYIGQIKGITRSEALPPEEVTARLERLVAQLGAESHKDREAATEALIKRGADIVPLLKGHLENQDPEIRQRIEEIIERLEGKGKQPVRPQMPGMING